MIGCMGESSLAISAAAALGGLADHLDLDSHLNLRNDPFVGAPLIDGRVLAADGPGLGVVGVGRVVRADRVIGADSVFGSDGVPE